MKNNEIESIYKNVIFLLEEYGRAHKSHYAEEQSLLFREACSKLKGLSDLSKKINSINKKLTTQLAFFFDAETDMFTFGSIKVKLNRASPTEKIKLDNISKAFPLDFQGKMSKEDLDLEKDLERLTRLYYQDAYRIIIIFRKSLGFVGFGSDPINLVRTLIEHPEGKPSGVFDSFVYSIVDGPMIKGLRMNSQTQDMDKGFYNNERQFLEDLMSVLSL